MFIQFAHHISVREIVNDLFPHQKHSQAKIHGEVVSDSPLK